MAYFSVDTPLLPILHSPFAERGEVPELAEGARLEIVCAPKQRTEGSNPSLSATLRKTEFRRRVPRNGPL